MMSSASYPVEPAADTQKTPELSLADIVREGLPDLVTQYGSRLSNDQRRALTAITQCHKRLPLEIPACGALLMHCGACGRN